MWSRGRGAAQRAARLDRTRGRPSLVPRTLKKATPRARTPPAPRRGMGRIKHRDHYLKKFPLHSRYPTRGLPLSSLLFLSLVYRLLSLLSPLPLFSVSPPLSPLFSASPLLSILSLPPSTLFLSLPLSSLPFTPSSSSPTNVHAGTPLKTPSFDIDKKKILFSRYHTQRN